MNDTTLNIQNSYNNSDCDSFIKMLVVISKTLDSFSFDRENLRFVSKNKDTNYESESKTIVEKLSFSDIKFAKYKDFIQVII